jgi:hypothetical protein
MKDPESALRVVRDSLPGVNKLISKAMTFCDGKVPKGQFLTAEVWDLILSKWGRGPSNDNIAVFLLTWQYSKSIYKFNDNIYNSLTKNEINGVFPVDVIYRLPYHCIYLDLEGREIRGSTLHGVWVRLDYNKKLSKHMICFCVNNNKLGENDKLICSSYSVILDKNNIINLLKESFIEAQKLFSNSHLTTDFYSEYESEAKVFLSLILYICSDEPDIICQDKVKTEHQWSVKTRHGQKLLPAPKVRIFNVGEEISKKIQEVNSYESGDKSVRAHIRKAHWHGYWVGKGRTEFKYNWVYPVIVNVELEKEILIG